MASGPSSAIPADPARLRRIFRHPLFQRHGAEQVGRRMFPDVPLIEGEKVDRARTRSVATDHAVYRAGGRLHRRRARTGRSSCTWPTPCRTCRSTSRTSSGASRAPGCSATCDGDRLVGRADPGGARAAWLDRSDAGHLHQRQRPLAALRQSRRLGPAAARRQGDQLRRGRARAVHHALARARFRPTRFATSR